MVYRYYSHFKFFCLNLFGLLASAQNVVMAYVIGTLVNMATAKDFSSIPEFFIKTIVFLLIILVANLLFNYLKADAVRQINTKLRLGVLKGMLFNEEEDASNLGFLTTDFKLLEKNRYNAEIYILLNLYTMILALVYALYLNWVLTVVYLIGSLIPTIISTFFQKSLRNAANDWTNANDKYVNQTKNLLAGTATFNLYGRQKNAVKQNLKKVTNLEQKLFKMNLFGTDTNALFGTIAMIGTYLFPFAIGTVLVIKGQTTLGALFAITQLSNSFINPILQILNERNNLSTTKGIVNKVNHYLSEAKKATSQKSISDFNELEVQNLTLTRQDKKLVQGLDITVKKGEKVAVIGPSGSGKSTLLQFLMYGKYGKAQGIFLDQNASKPGSFDNIFAYSSQSAVIFSDTLWFNLTLGVDLDKEEVMNVCDGVALGELVREKGFAYHLGDNADQLSGGQLSRIELARSILAKRPVLLLDEVNASLDKVTSKSIHEYLFKSDYTFVEVIHHYDSGDLKNYDAVIDLSNYQTETKD